MAEVDNKQVIFKRYIDRLPEETDMEIKVSKIKLEAPKGSGAFLVKNLYLSCDPYMRGRMRDFRDSYIPPYVPGQITVKDHEDLPREKHVWFLPSVKLAIPYKMNSGVAVFYEEFCFIVLMWRPGHGESELAVPELVPLEGFGVSQVIDSDNPDFKPGDLVSLVTGWEEYSLIHRTEQLRKIQPDDIPLSYHVGLLGMPGFTSYAGFFEVCSPKKGEFVYVSAASGAVGQLVGQLAKLHGCYVVGSAGTSQKIDILKNKLGFDDAFNYKEERDLDAALKRYFPQGIDIYFDNVGGEMLDAALLNMRIHGRIAVCGAVSQQSFSKPRGIFNGFNLISKRIRMQGFLQHDYLHLYPRFLEDVISNYQQGKIVYIEDMNEGLDSAPAASVGLFSGKNVGKQVIRVAHE